MHTVDSLIHEVLRREGGYVDHPDDTGGATNHGISLRYIRGIGFDPNGDGVIDARDIKIIGPETAAELYRQEFFMAPRIYRLPEPLQAQVFDMAVNMGPPRAIMLLQEMVGTEPDGVIGPRTISRAARYIEQRGPSQANNELAKHRIDFYRRLAERRPSQQAFLKGWISRSQEFVT